MAQILDGKRLAEQLKPELKTKITAFQKKAGRVPGIAVILIGDDPASHLYVKNKLKVAAELDLHTFPYMLPSSTSEKMLLDQIESLNQNPSVDGILIQLPLPSHIPAEKILSRVHPHKDIDGFHAENIGKLALKQKGLHPCTPKGIMTLLQHYTPELRGKHAVVVGASNIVGRPMALELLNAGCTITVCHRATQDLSAETRRADLLVVATGVPHLINASMIKPGAIVVDVGIHRSQEGNIQGDVDFKSVSEIASWITPVPGGVGPMTIISLMQNLLLAAERAH